MKTLATGYFLLAATVCQLTTQASGNAFMRPLVIKKVPEKGPSSFFTVPVILLFPGRCKRQPSQRKAV
jgi:hypothetical protein